MGDNTLAGIPQHTTPLKKWNQGFRINEKTGLVLFLSKGRCERIAVQAAQAVGQDMEVVPHEDMWGYRPVQR